MFLAQRRLSRHLIRVLHFAAIAASNHYAMAADSSHKTWQNYLGNSDSSHYSALKQINRANVGQLQQAWIYSTSDNESYAFNPIVVDDVMFVLAKNRSIVALNAATGQELWAHPLSTSKPGFERHRGIAYWESKDRSDRRLLFTTENYLQEIDARTGQMVASFGQNGKVNLREGLGIDSQKVRRIQSGTPGRIFENLIILGSSPGEEYDSPPGHIRAYNVLTGKMEWIFHTIPQPGEFGYETWPKDAWKRIGGTNTWGEITIDEKRGIAYLPIGSPTYDFYGADRHGANLFATCLVALDARTGKRIWHFQFVHHDLWDYDPSAAPQLLTVRHNGKDVDVVAQATKQGFVFVFERQTGKPLWPIEERPVPKSDMPEESAWPTQPFPTAPPPFGRQKFTADDVNEMLNPDDHGKLRDRLLSARNEGLFTPPGLRDTVEMPGNNGGCNFHCTAVNPEHGTLYILSKDVPSILKLERTPQVGQRLRGTSAQQGRMIYQQNCQLCHGPELQGQAPATPSLANILNRRSADDIKTIVRNGQGQMPAFAKLDDNALTLLITFLTNPASGIPANEHEQPSAQSAAAMSGPAPSSTTPTAEGNDRKRYWTGYGYLETNTMLSPIKPPFSSLTAYDLNKGVIRWTVPFGNVPEYAAKGITGTGTVWPKNGVAVTAGGLLFAATRSEGKLRAYDQETGKQLWEVSLPAGSEGVPAVYEVNGRQYVAVCAGSPPTSRTSALPGTSETLKRAYVAFALPEEKKR